MEDYLKHLKVEEKELLESIITMAYLFGYEKSNFNDGFTLLKNNKQYLSFMIYEKKLKLRLYKPIIKNGYMKQQQSRKPSTRIELIQKIAKYLE